MGTPKCKLWLPKKNRFCANVPLSNSPFCGNHTERSDAQWTPCPIDPSHSVLEENLESHLKRCPLLKQVQSLSLQPYYQKGINGGKEEEEEGYQDEETSISAGFNDFDNPSSFSEENITSEMKRRDLYAMGVSEFFKLISKIKSIHASIRNSIRDSFKIPEACSVWINREVDRKIPFQEKHVMQQASILGNLEELGVLNDAPAVVEFGAGRGYLTQMLADCYGIKKVVLVERKSYKLKADRSLRQKESLILERLRIDIEDLNLNAVDSLQGGVPFLAIGKHLCGPATDMTLRCCLAKRSNVVYPRGLAIATCCHHLCQWKHYINKRYFLNMGIKKEDFHAISWFTSWAVDADHSDDISGGSDYGSHLPISINIGEGEFAGVEEILGKMTATERAILGFMCKDIIDGGRLIWIKEEGLESDFVKYVPSNISPENHLLVAKQV